MPFVLSITIPSSSVASTLTNFPIYVDLGSLDASFWTDLAHDDGGDIRIKDGPSTSDTDLPFDVVTINRADETGALFTKVPSVSHLADTVLYLHYGDVANTMPAVGDSNGRNAVWSDYHRVFCFAPDDGFVDHTGNGTAWVPTANTTNGNVSAFSQASVSPDVLSHQGVAWDGTHYYTTDTNAIRKWDASWNLVATNSDPCGDTGIASVDHLGDLDVVSGVLYVGIAITGGASPHICTFNASDLSFVAATDVSAHAAAAGNLAYCEGDGFLYQIIYSSPCTTINRYSVPGLVYQSALTLSTSIPFVNGITWWREHFWLAGQMFDINSAQKFIVPVDFDGTVQSKSVQYARSGWAEGLSHTDDALLFLHSTGDGQGVVYELTPLNLAAGGGIRVKANALNNPTNANGGGKATGLTRFTTWTLGVSALISTKLAASMSLSSYTEDASTDDTKRASTAWRQSTDRLGIWNNADGWVEGSGAPSVDTHYRMHDVHESTTQRKYYENGVLKGTDLTITAMPAATATAIYLGFDDASAAQPWQGNIGFLYLRASALSADWIAAEALNLLTPGSFYTPGTPAVVGGFNALMIAP